jgi:ABC-type Fe3+ transport system substrate-binding protein
MQRYAFLFGFLLVLAAPFVVRGAFLERHDRSELPGANAPELRILTPHNQDIRYTFARAFSAWHEAKFGARVKVLYLTPGGTLDIVRYITDSYASVRDRGSGRLADEARVAAVAELVWGGGDSTFERELKPFLKPVTLSRTTLDAAFPEADLNGIPLYERSNGPPRWVGIVLSSFGVLYSPELYRELALPPPTTWQDLTRPELTGLVALADPTRSGSAAVVYLIVIQRAMTDTEQAFFAAAPQRSTEQRKSDPGYGAALEAGFQRGMALLTLMAANARYFTDSASQPPNDVGNGEAAAAVAIDFYARVFQDQVGEARLRYVAPHGATAFTPDPIGVLYGTRGEREVLANRFVEFLLTPEAQQLWNLEGGKSPFVERSLRRLPIRRDVYANREGFADDVDPFRDAGDFNLRLEWMSTFRELRLVWGAAWIDGKSALDAAHRTLLEVRDPAQRAALLGELARLPITLAEVASIAAQRKSINDPRLFLARARVDLGLRFRAHYQAVARKAEQR